MIKGQTQTSLIFHVSTHHIKNLSEGDTDPDLDCFAGVDDRPHLLVVVLHEVTEQSGLLLVCLPPLSVGVISGI